MLEFKKFKKINVGQSGVDVYELDEAEMVYAGI